MSNLHKPSAEPLTSADMTGHTNASGWLSSNVIPCVLCGHTPATVADHHPISKRELIRQHLNPSDPALGRGLCKPCHNAHTAHAQPGGWNIARRRVRIDARLYPLTMTIAATSALAALLGVLLGQLLARRNDYTKWLRDQRLAACSGFLALEAELSGSCARYVASGWGSDAREAFFGDVRAIGGRLVAQRCIIELVCPEYVGDEAEKMSDLVVSLAKATARDSGIYEGSAKEREAARRAFVGAVRKSVRS